MPYLKKFARLGHAEAGWLSRPETQLVLAALTAAGFEARVVGGAVRNALMGLPVADVDIATTAEPWQIEAAAARAGLRTIPTGIAHGTVTVIAGSQTYEVTTLRRDIETDGRRARVAFTDDWAADAGRRDFTINALYCAGDGTLFDPVHGLPDIEARRVRFIGDPVARIREDFLRILRFFRFSANFGGLPLDADGLSACIREREGLRHLSAERVRAELLKVLVAPQACLIVAVMAETGILGQLTALVPRPGVFERLAGLEDRLSLPVDPIRRLAAIALHGPGDAEGLARRLRLSSAERLSLELLEPDHAPAADMRLTLYRHGRDGLRDRMILQIARTGAPLDQEVFERIASLPVPVFPAAGRDLVTLGLAPGPAVGHLLRELERDFIASGFALTREDLLSTAKTAIERAQSRA